MFEFTNKKKVLVVAGILILIVGGILYYFLQGNDEEYIEFTDDIENIENEGILNEVNEVKNQIVVHILGEVNCPGVITLEEGSRIIDAINMAEGATEQADLSKINLAYILEDAQRVYIPNINDKEDSKYILSESGETEIATGGSGDNTKKGGTIMININTASAEELQSLPGIGESIASRIVEYRNKNGKFKTIEDIKNVSGIGDSKFDKIKDNICVK